MLLGTNVENIALCSLFCPSWVLAHVHSGDHTLQLISCPCACAAKGKTMIWIANKLFLKLQEAKKLNGQTLLPCGRSLYRTLLLSEQIGVLSYPPTKLYLVKENDASPYVHKPLVKHELEEIGLGTSHSTRYQKYLNDHPVYGEIELTKPHGRRDVSALEQSREFRL